MHKMTNQTGTIVVQMEEHGRILRNMCSGNIRGLATAVLIKKCFLLHPTSLTSGY
jgi:hypothetical protein